MKSSVCLSAVRPAGKERVGYAAQSFNVPEISGVMSGWISGTYVLMSLNIYSGNFIIFLSLSLPTSFQIPMRLLNVTLLDLFFWSKFSYYLPPFHSSLVSCLIFLVRLFYPWSDSLYLHLHPQRVCGITSRCNKRCRRCGWMCSSILCIRMSRRWRWLLQCHTFSLCNTVLVYIILSFFIKNLSSCRSISLYLFYNIFFFLH